jgi:hypothetical protein
MANFDLSKYATVAERMEQLKRDYPDYRIITENLTTEADRARSTWVVKATLYLSDGDQAAELPKSTGHAFEIDGQGMANKTSALENAESSAIGRCLMVGGYAMSKDGKTLASREEMQKVERALGKNDWLLEASKLNSVEDLRKLYAKANVSKADKATLDEIKRRADELTTSKPQGTGGGVSGSAKK